MSPRYRREGHVPRTEGLSPKVPVQAVVTIIAFVAAYFGIDLSAELSGAIGVILGSIGGIAARPGKVIAG